jgi:cytochrome P450
MQQMGQLPWLDEYFRLRLKSFFLRVGKVNAIVTFSAQHIAEHRTQGGNPDFVTRFKEAAEKYPDIITPAQLQDYAVTNVSAGSDTTAIVFRSVIHYLLTNRRVYDHLMEEIKTVLQARPRDDSFNKHMSWTEARQMVYLQACLKEGLRLHPPLGQILPRLVPPGGITICGQYLKEGTEVGCNAWTVHRDRTVFGEDADVFRPERWLDVGLEKSKEMDRCNFVFGSGSRTCKITIQLPVSTTIKAYHYQVSEGMWLCWSCQKLFPNSSGLLKSHWLIRKGTPIAQDGLSSRQD